MSNIDVDSTWEESDTEEAPEEEVAPTLKYEIMNYPADTTLQGYLDLWNRDELVVPDFQREFIWDQVRASKLIESFLLGLPVPGVFLFKERDSANYLIVDGQQRITSIVSFLKGMINDRAFKLKNVESRWDGKKFSDLSEDEQFRLKGCVLRSTIIQQINPDDNTSIYHIFERLNTGGVNLTTMEIRQCISMGPLMTALVEMNKDENWRLLLGRPKADKRLRDVELVLRCLALAGNGREYDKPMKGFLNEYMEEEKLNPSDYDEMKKNFKETCASLVEGLGSKPFHLRGRLNYGLLDAMLATSLQLNPCRDFGVTMAELLDNELFLDAISKSTSDTGQVATRLDTAENAFLK